MGSISQNKGKPGTNVACFHSVMQRALQQSCSLEKASGAGPEAVLSTPVTPAAAEDEGPCGLSFPENRHGIVRAVLLC